MIEWHYNGSIGQLGPLKDDQVKELIEVGVIESTTLVWREGLNDWIQARNCPELLAYFGNAPRSSAVPPPLPRTFDVNDGAPLDGPKPDIISYPPPSSPHIPPQLPAGAMAFTTVTSYTMVSDKSRLVAGLLNFIPGLGRFYLGYSAIGFLQFCLAFCGIGAIWSIIDGILMLLGSCPVDGYGRRLIK